MTYELTSCLENERTDCTHGDLRRDCLLHLGWEPMAVDNGRIWFRRVKQETREIFLQAISKEDYGTLVALANKSPNPTAALKELMQNYALPARVTYDDLYPVAQAVGRERGDS
jgi:hypothetical protein